MHFQFWGVQMPVTINAAHAVIIHLVLNLFDIVILIAACLLV